MTTSIQNLKKISLILLIMATPTSLMASPAPTKYISSIHRLAVDHTYLQEHKAPTYWRISPYYQAQRNETSCSLASATMIVNAARSMDPKFANQNLATQDTLLKLVNLKAWSKEVAPDGNGVTLDELSHYVPAALEKFGVTNFSIKKIHVYDNSEKSLKRFQDELIKLEAGKAFILANYNLAYFTNEPGGHISPIAAYDAANQKVLIMDVYRYKFEPYWVPVKLLLKSMGSLDNTSSTFRGYIVITFIKK
ncbi:MAG: C39 family peptidase [Legionella sp.]|nr:C39 family peptidase [Legionella sp.]